MYGNYSFLRSTFEKMIEFMSLNTKDAFFTYNSKNTDSSKIILWYRNFNIIMVGLLIVFIVGAFMLQANTFLWPNLNMLLVILVALFACIVFIESITTGYGDSKGLTVKIQILKIIINICWCISLLILYFYDQLNIYSFITISSIQLLIISLLSLLIYIKNKNVLNSTKPDNNESINKYILRYCSPLFLFSIIVFIHGYFDRWFLQLVDGSTEQAYFYIGWRFAEICFMFTASITPIYYREIANAHGGGDVSKMQTMYKKYIKLFYFIISMIVVFSVFQIEELINIFLGDEYTSALIPIIIICFYPIFRTLGQLNGALLMATEQTNIIRNIALIELILGILLTYALVAPSHYPLSLGLNLGSTGLALKTVFIGLIGAYIQLWMNTKYLNIKRLDIIGQNISVIIVLLLLFYSINYTSNFFIQPNTLFLTLIKMSIEGIVYLAFIIVIIIKWPGLAGLTTEDLRLVIKKMKNKLFI